MAKISREEIVRSALEALHEGGIDALSTRRLARRLGVESPALYWHFRSKAELLAAMAAEITAAWHTLPIPEDPGAWRPWFAENARSFRRALLAFRDGARLHAGSRPSRLDLARLVHKIAYLERAGFERKHALMALYAGSQFTVGCVLEEQARRGAAEGSPGPEEGAAGLPAWLTDAIAETARSGAEAAFEFGLELLIDGLGAQQGQPSRSA